MKASMYFFNAGRKITEFFSLCINRVSERDGYLGTVLEIH